MADRNERSPGGPRARRGRAAEGLGAEVALPGNRQPAYVAVGARQASLLLLPRPAGIRAEETVAARDGRYLVADPQRQHAGELARAARVDRSHVRQLGAVAVGGLAGQIDP